MRRVWDWLEVSGSREQPLGLGSASDAVQFGQMHLSEGSPATTVITTALDASRCDAVEPCVSSLPDAQGETFADILSPFKGSWQDTSNASAHPQGLCRTHELLLLWGITSLVVP